MYWLCLETELLFSETSLQNMVGDLALEINHQMCHEDVDFSTNNTSIAFKVNCKWQYLHWFINDAVAEWMSLDNNWNRSNKPKPGEPNILDVADITLYWSIFH